MSNDCMLFIIGDTHGEWGKFNKLLNEIRQNYKESCNGKEVNIIVCGDFGYWPNEKQYDINKIKNKCEWTQNGYINIYFCPGNHEDWWALNKIEKSSTEKIIELQKSIFYCTFGSIKEFNRKTFMFCGGADSIDKNFRTLGWDWFPEEIISISDMYKLPPDDTNIDVIISHTCPTFMTKYIGNKLIGKICKDPSCDLLEQIYNMFKPSQWFFGHFHIFQKNLLKTTTFTCLNMIGGHKGVSVIEFNKD